MKYFAKAALAAVATACAILPIAAVNAQSVTYDLTGLQTFDARLDASNTVAFFNIGAGSHVTGLTYNVTISTIGDSWRSEAAFAYTDSPITDGVLFRPGIADTSSGTSTYIGTSDLVGLGLDFFVGANGLLRVELYESFDDIPDTADANLSGSLTFLYTPAQAAVPEAATWAMMLGGFAMTGAAMRRRKVRVSYAS